MNENEQELQEVLDADARDKVTYPLFVKAAEQLTRDQISKLAEIKRNYGSPEKATEKDLVNAHGVAVSTYTLGKKHMPMLLMRMDSNDAPVYIPITDGGTSFRHLENFIDQDIKILITKFISFDDVNNKQKKGQHYIAMGSITNAEQIVGKELYDEFQKNPEEAKNKDRVGVVSRVVVANRLSIVMFNYRGITLGMLERNFHQRSLTHPITRDAYIGKSFKFRISNITKTTYEDMTSVKNDENLSHIELPSGTRYFIETTSLPFIPNYDEEVKKLYEQRAWFSARIARYDSVKGILVEIAPGWWIKGFLPANSIYKPTIQDQIHHTLVTVRINRIDFEKHTGQAYIHSFPQGVAAPSVDSVMDQNYDIDQKQKVIE